MAKYAIIITILNHTTQKTAHYVQASPHLALAQLSISVSILLSFQTFSHSLNLSLLFLYRIIINTRNITCVVCGAAAADALLWSHKKKIR